MPDINWTGELLILMNVVIAAVLTGFIGLEREVKDKPAGFRTNMIVGGSSALILSLGKVLVESYIENGLQDVIQPDPTRIIEAIILGISFIGAGTILKGKGDEESKVYYLTTAATVLFSAGIGIAVALEQYVLSISATLLLLIINRLAKRLNKKV
ncbi:MgtC/SapB family protein [Psychroflexus sp. CAK57W]|uniref:MgtC/SapB family protein n=1 Tax=Psychroflexus curvus TaxID=2873595 RepID=UPI001CCCFF9C|nr:MgtC/SapB family protein [Psychroflexus curvus]MBZ9628847.1 MgtC/SapB family protein [Psychroflexus curvus]MBZ9788176.1 MgtC/SapB family protein [Psychroflexus curvus]